MHSSCFGDDIQMGRQLLGAYCCLRREPRLRLQLRWVEGRRRVLWWQQTTGRVFEPGRWIRGSSGAWRAERQHGIRRPCDESQTRIHRKHSLRQRAQLCSSAVGPQKFQSQNLLLSLLTKIIDFFIKFSKPKNSFNQPNKSYYFSLSK